MPKAQSVNIIVQYFFKIFSHIKMRNILQNQINLRGTVASTETVRVYRNSKVVENIPSSDLVPGDIIELPKHQAIVVCDAVLLTGQCILNESMLTGTIEQQLDFVIYFYIFIHIFFIEYIILGESVPVTKTPLPSHHILYDSKECSHHTMYSGTTIIQTRYYYI